MDIAEILSGIRPSDGGFHLDPPRGWYQGRALYGGLGAALCLAAAKRDDADLPPVRSAQVSFLAPATGEIRLVPQILRRGRSATVASVDLLGNEGLAVRALLVFGQARESTLRYDRVDAPPVAPPDACPPLPAGLPMADFFANFEARPAGGATPLSRAAEHELLSWVRFRGDARIDPEIALFAMADVLPPAAMVGMSQPVPISSMTWHIDVAQPAVMPPWYLVRSFGEQAGEGYARQEMTCWSTDGRCLAIGRQTVAIFG